MCGLFLFLEEAVSQAMKKAAPWDGFETYGPQVEAYG